MDVRIPLGTLLNPIRPAALSCRTHLLGRTLDLLIGTLGQRQPKLMTAAGYSDSKHMSGLTPVKELISIRPSYVL